MAVFCCVVVVVDVVAVEAVMQLCVLRFRAIFVSHNIFFFRPCTGLGLAWLTPWLSYPGRKSIHKIQTLAGTLQILKEQNCNMGFL